MQPWLKRIDHLICEVPDIVSTFEVLTRRWGFPEAWPIGRFWPEGRTCGVALGGANLELMQPDSGAPTTPRLSAIAFEPVDLSASSNAFVRSGIAADVREKWEADPALLQLRGLPAGAGPQLICTNLVPSSPSAPFFVCAYAPLLKARLSPARLGGPPAARLSSVLLRGPDASQWRQAIGVLAEGPELRIEESDDLDIELKMSSGPLDLYRLLSG